MYTSDDLLKAVEDVNSAPIDVSLEEFVGLSENTIEEFLKAASTPMSEDEMVYMTTGMIVALRAVKNGADSNGE